VRLKLIFGGPLNQFGWLLLGVGMFFYWIFGTQSDLDNLLVFRGQLAFAKGTVLDCEATDFSESEIKVYAHRYGFEHNGERYENTSYTTGNQVAAGQRVNVEFPAGSPETSRIVGMRSKPFGPWAMLVVLIPLGGLMIVIVGSRKGQRGISLMRNGETSVATFVSKRKTSRKVGDMPVWEYLFTFDDVAGTEHEITGRTHEDYKFDDFEPVVYAYGNPKRAVLLKELPGFPQIDGEGAITASGYAPLVLILPTLTIVSNIGYALYRAFDAV